MFSKEINLRFESLKFKNYQQTNFLYIFSSFYKNHKFSLFPLKITSLAFFFPHTIEKKENFNQFPALYFRQCTKCSHCFPLPLPRLRHQLLKLESETDGLDFPMQLKSFLFSEFNAINCNLRMCTFDTC